MAVTWGSPPLRIVTAWNIHMIDEDDEEDRAAAPPSMAVLQTAHFCDLHTMATWASCAFISAPTVARTLPPQRPSPSWHFCLESSTRPVRSMRQKDPWHIPIRLGLSRHVAAHKSHVRV